jgi:hypothetical protein
MSFGRAEVGMNAVMRSTVTLDWRIEYYPIPSIKIIRSIPAL